MRERLIREYIRPARACASIMQFSAITELVLIHMSLVHKILFLLALNLLLLILCSGYLAVCWDNCYHF